MVANIRGYTPNYSFKLINFDTPRWHTLEYANWNMVDAMFLQNGTPQVRGGWQNNTLYLIGDRTFDEDTSATYRCLVEHTSAEFGTFVEDRTANPTYWSLQLAGTPVYRAEWMPAVAYVLGDIVEVDEYAYYLCTEGHTSSATFAADALKWQKVFDATVVVADAEAAKAAAYQFSLDAQGSANDAASSATDAQTAEDNAEGWADEARAATGGFRWAFSSSTTAEDPAVGRVAFNNANPTLVTEMYVSSQSAEIGNPDVSDWLITWDDSTNVDTRGTIQIRKVGSPEQFLLFQLTGSIVDNGTWLKFTVSYALHSGTVTNGEQLSLGFVRAGDTGPTGTGGGDMLRSNNLSDVVSVPTSRNNLGLGTAQIPTFSQVLLGNVPSADMHAATKLYVDASPSLYISDTAPIGVQDGSLWWDSDRGTLLVRYNDGDSTQWVDAVAVPGLDTSQLATKSYVDAADNAIRVAAAPLDALNYSGMQINGSMEVSQENGENIVAVTALKYIVDGWFIVRSGTGDVNGVQHAAQPSNFTKSISVYAGGTPPSTGSGDYVLLQQNIEGYRWSRLGFATGNAVPVTIGFWVYSTTGGVLSVALRNSSPNRCYITTVTCGVASWQYKTITIPPDTTGTWQTTNSAGASVSFCMNAGSTFTTATLNAWQSGNLVAATTQANHLSTPLASVYITGVTILPGIVAPTAAQSPLIMRPYDQELVTCQRYWEPVTITTVGMTFTAGGHPAYSSHQQKVVKRAAPTLAIIGTPTLVNVTCAVDFGSDRDFRTQITSVAAGIGYVSSLLVSCNARL